VYSFGLAMWEVVHNDFAFSGFDDLVAFREVPFVVSVCGGVCGVCGVCGEVFSSV
jgi:hypothetical protein